MVENYKAQVYGDYSYTGLVKIPKNKHGYTEKPKKNIFPINAGLVKIPKNKHGYTEKPEKNIFPIRN